MHDAVEQAHFAVFCDHAEFSEEAEGLPLGYGDRSAFNDESTSQNDDVVRREIIRANTVEPRQKVDARLVHV